MEYDDARIKGPKTLYLHIGIPKTASTWLQHEVFPKIEHLLCLNYPQSELFKVNSTHPGKHRIMGGIFKLSSHIWTEYGDTIFEELIGDRQSWLAERKDLLISDEMMGRRGSRPVLLSAHIHEMKKKSLEWGFEQFKIIYIIRRQDHWLASHYAQISDRNPKAGQADFERVVRKIVEPGRARYGFGMLLDYDILYEHLTKVTDKDDILILPYEMLKNAPDTFLKKILQKLNTPENNMKSICDSTADKKANVRSGQEKETWKLRNNHNRMMRNLIPQWLLRKRTKMIEISPEIKKLIHQAFSDGNQNLAEKTDIDLAQYGYISFDEILKSDTLKER